MYNPISKQLSKRLSKYYKNCNQLPLKVFCDIVNTKDYSLLAYNKLISNAEYELELWSEILIEYGELEGDNNTKERLEKVKYLNELKNTYTVLVAMYEYCWITTPDNDNTNSIIKDLDKMGYKVDTSSSIAYRESLISARRKMNSIVTIMRMKANELENKGEESDINFDDLMAMLQSYYNVDDNITVSRYISMKKNIMKRQKTKDQISDNKSKI